ncbi:uncharacterized protein [Vicugna pacos]|uniref:Uncharacterized protein n=1 Tax=Vicugna pacos TaxID=30538 RepID=A0ABM5D2A8_VICPA
MSSWISIHKTWIQCPRLPMFMLFKPVHSMTALSIMALEEIIAIRKLIKSKSSQRPWETSSCPGRQLLSALEDHDSALLKEQASELDSALREGLPRVSQAMACTSVSHLLTEDFMRLRLGPGLPREFRKPSISGPQAECCLWAGLVLHTELKSKGRVKTQGGGSLLQARKRGFTSNQL